MSTAAENDSTQTSLQRARSFVDWTLRRAGRLWAAAAVVAVLGAAGTARLSQHFNGDLEALLPRDSASVRALDEMRVRVQGLQSLGVVVDCGSADRLPAALRFLDDLAARVRTYGPALVHAVRTGLEEERAFVEANAPLYADLGDLAEIR